MKSIENNKLEKISSTDFKSSYTKIAKTIKSNPKPHEITENDKTDLIVMSSEFFESMMDLIEDYEDRITTLNQKMSNSSTFITTDELFKGIK